MNQLTLAARRNTVSIDLDQKKWGCFSPAQETGDLETCPALISQAICQDQEEYNALFDKLCRGTKGV